jgi:Cytochrome oxidase complex assembly protein 1
VTDARIESEEEQAAPSVVAAGAPEPARRPGRRWLRRNLRLLLLSLAGMASLAGAAVAGLVAVEHASKGPAYRASSLYLRNSRTVRRELGAVVGFGFTVAGSVRDGPSFGRADIGFDVIGSWRTGHVDMHAVKRDGRWQVVSGTLRVGGHRFPLRPGDELPLRPPGARQRTYS